MFINFWYPAEESKNVTAEKPLHVRMLGLDFVLFRDTAGNAHCLSNICVHRGSFLADGKVKGDAVECPYHGWQFNGAGACTRIPSMGPNAQIPNRAKVDSYPVVEKYGLVFCFLGDLPEEERPPIMAIPEWDDPQWRFLLETYTWKTNWQRAIENTLDPAHTEFVHPAMGYGGAKDEYQVPKLEPSETAWGCGVMTTFDAPQAADPSLRAGPKPTGALTSAGAGNHGPAATWTHINPGPMGGFRQYSFGLPVDEYTYKRFFFGGRNFALDPAMDERMAQANNRVMEQDRAVIERIEPVLTPPTNSKEVMVPADAVITRFREFVKDWEGRGWRIDTEALAKARAGNRAFVIPSPARRTHKGWAIDTVPLVGVKTAVAEAAD
jgi:phenylpropionate dioxygenase-like ring-hydroxylating dioxygenase large terminal subunit